jgi:hypothetical protein
MAPKAGKSDGRREPTAEATRREGLDPGAFVGRLPERQAETIPGGVSRKDERISAVASQVGEASPDPGATDPPSGHREGTPASDTSVREAGQNR